MACGMFGKLAAKRDFISVGAPQNFLKVWEPWIGGSITASRLKLGQAWQDAYLTAPIWRFWLGPAICGTSQLGAFMPSLDGIGRYYPLTVLATPRGGQAFAPPEMDLHEGWFEAAENFLLATLEPSLSFDDILGQLDALPQPEPHPFGEAGEGQTRLAQTCLFAAPDNGVSASLFAQMRAADWLSIHAGRSYWWTQGGDGFVAQAIGAQGMPPPEVFAGFLTGDYGFNQQPALT